MIQFTDVSIRKGDTTILENLHIQLKAPFKTAVLGVNGSGKSTLLDAIAGRIFPQKGRIEKSDSPKIVLVPRDYSFSRLIGSAYQYYQQRYAAYDSEIGPSLREVLQDQVIPVGTIDEKSVDKKEPAYSENWLNEVCENLNIHHLLERKVTSLSNGETRRSLLAWALLKKPDLLLLDSPFTGLDTRSKELLCKIIDELPVNVLLVCGQNELPDSISEIIWLENRSVRATLNRPFPEKIVGEKSVNLDGSLLKEVFLHEDSTFETAFKIENGTVKYGEKLALDGVNWEVKKGEKWALMGPNGSGKTTLLSLLSADNPKAYQNKIVLFDRRRGTGESIWDIKKKIGFVSPELHLFFPKNSTAFKVVASGLFDSIGLYRKLKPEEGKTTHKLMEALSLDHLKDKWLNQLSAGEQRQILLARALIKNPPLLLLDEACQNLDYQHMVYFRELVDTLVNQFNKTLIYVTHNPEEIPASVNRFIYLENGQVIRTV